MREDSRAALSMADPDDHAAEFTWSATQKALGEGRILIRVIGTWARPPRPVRATLSRAPFQSSNPNVLALSLSAEIAAGPVPPHVPTVTVAYEQTGNRRYRLVTIQPDSVDIAVEDED